MIELLEWDSKFFNYSVGKLTVSEQNEQEVYNEIADNGHAYRVIYVQSEKPLLSVKGLKLVDIKTTLSTVIPKEFHEDSNIKSFKKNKSNYPELIDLALLSGSLSRFKVDTEFKNKEFELLYKAWLDGCLYGNKSIEILGYIVKKKVVGFVTIERKNISTASIGLIAVNEKHHGKGIASQLILNCFSVAEKHNFKVMNVVTQKNNTAALSLYRKMGFEIIESSYIYHFRAK